MIRQGFGLILALSMLASAPAAASHFRLVYTFSGLDKGAAPSGTLMLDRNGKLYGTTSYGPGGGCSSGLGCGIVFSLTPKGKEKVLYTFKGGSDGGHPWARLVRDNDGNLYGMTVHGGGGSCDAGNGCGTIFKLAKDGTETILHAFTGKADGGAPNEGLLLDDQGNLYGTAYSGGAHKQGVIFKISTVSGALSVLHDFCARRDCQDGAEPDSGLIADSAGNLYGATFTGGAFETYGTVYRLAPGGKFKVLHSFNWSDGEFPNSDLVLDEQGNLYGTTQGGEDGSGTIFKLAPDGALSKLHNFTIPQGQVPNNLIRSAEGDFYGSAVYGGSGVGVCEGVGCGTVFKLAKDGTFTLLHLFTGGSDGTYPNPVIFGPDGSLFGTTSGGNTVFKIKP